MTNRVRELPDPQALGGDELPPELLEILAALAEAQARKDYAARFGPLPEPK